LLEETEKTTTTAPKYVLVILTEDYTPSSLIETALLPFSLSNGGVLQLSTCPVIFSVHKITHNFFIPIWPKEMQRKLDSKVVTCCPTSASRRQ
jgi:hypothetical protein